MHYRAIRRRAQCAQGGLKLDQAKRVKDQENENANLKRAVLERSQEKQVLKHIAEGKFQGFSGGVVRWSMRGKSTNSPSDMLDGW